MRKLLPYEHALIEALGITEEEYFAFRKAQREYNDAKAGTALDVRNGLETGTVALILSIVGTLAQVGAALLAPKPEAPEITGGGRRARDRRFAPRSGFDSLQDLAQYGEPVNLVYGNQGTGFNDNPNGGVRVNTSLLWSAVYSYGNTQYIQMMAAIGSGEIVDIDYDLTAVGQTLVRLFRGGSNATKFSASVWQYFKNSGAIVKSDLKNGSGSDPLLVGVESSRTVYDPLIDTTVRSQGFSQAFSPSSSREFGISSPVPIKVNVFARNEEGVPKKKALNIEMENRGNYWPSIYGASRPLIPEGHQMTLVIAKVKDRRGDGEADNLADEIRYSAAESFEIGALYKLGSAKFQAVNISGDTELDKQRMTVTLECVESGYGPFEDYQTEDIFEQEQELEQQRDAIRRNLDASIPGTIAYQLANLNSSQFATTNLTAKQSRLFGALRDQLDTVEDLYEAVVSYKRDKKNMDEFVLAAEAFDPVVVAIATEVNEQEANLERRKYRKERINSVIANQGSTPDREKNLEEAVAEIAEIRKTLRTLRGKLAKAIEEYGVADGVVASQLASAQSLLRSIKQSFANEQLSGLSSVKIPGYIETGGNPTARVERRALRKLKNALHDMSMRLAGVAQIDFAAYEEARTNLQNQLNQQQLALDQVVAQLKNPDSFNDYLGVKCLTRVNEASYETLSASNLVHFSIKAKVFMRIQGRASKYGETKAEKFKDADNGNKPRTAMFTVSYKKVGAANASWRSPNVIFCVRRTFDKDVFLPLIFRSPDADGTAKWEFKFSPVYDAPSEALKKGAFGSVQFVYLEGRGAMKQVPGEPFYYRGYSRNPGINNLPPKNQSPFGVDEWTVYSARGDTAMQFSFDNGPEFSISAVSEQQFVNLSTLPSLYSNIATIGLNAYSGAGLTSMRNLSVFARKGKKVRNIELSPPSYPSLPNAPSCWAPDIFLDTILDEQNGIRSFVDAVNEESVDIEKLALAKAFCIKQRYFMDGVIAERQSWRAFWSEVAPFSLLELARIGGKETLIPAVPTTGDGTITRNVTVSALFNQGNILEDSYKEEFLDYGESTQDLIASIIYREQSVTEPFPRNTSVTIKLKDANENLSSRVSFDLSNFVTNRNQAINYGMLLVQQRRHARRAVEFKTFPTEAPVAPGSYIYVHMEENQWNDIHSGAVLDDGSLNVPFASGRINGTYDTLIYEPGKEPIKQVITYTNGQSSVLSNYKGKGVLFVLGSQIKAKRVFRVTEVAMEEEGEVTIRAIEHPCEEEGGQAKSKIVRFDPSLYDIA
jgi:hypothetical protein